MCIQKQADGSKGGDSERDRACHQLNNARRPAKNTIKIILDVLLTDDSDNRGKLSLEYKLCIDCRN